MQIGKPHKEYLYDMNPIINKVFSPKKCMYKQCCYYSKHLDKICSTCSNNVNPYKGSNGAYGNIHNHLSQHRNEELEKKYYPNE